MIGRNCLAPFATTHVHSIMHCGSVFWAREINPAASPILILVRTPNTAGLPWRYRVQGALLY